MDEAGVPMSQAANSKKSRNKTAVNGRSTGTGNKNRGRSASTSSSNSVTNTKNLAANGE